MLKILFICGKNKMRSPTADVHFSSYAGIQTDSAGVSRDADQLLTPEQIEWSDIIFFMERKYLKRVSDKFGKQLAFKKVICLGIPDVYQFMQAELVELLVQKIEPHIQFDTSMRDSIKQGMAEPLAASAKTLSW